MPIIQDITPKSAVEEEIIRLKKEKLFRLEEEPWRYFVPTGKAEEFIQNVGSGKYFISLFSAANGIGKTCVSINMMLNLFWPDCRSKWFDSPLWKSWPYVKKARIVSDPTLITSSLIPEIKKWFPRGRYKTDKCGKNYEYKWTTDTGWEFTIMSFDQDPKEFEGVTLGLCMTGDNRILLSNGEWKEIKDIKKGDEVVSYGDERNKGINQPRIQNNQKVIDKFCTGEKEVFKLSTTKNYSVTATANHRFFVSGKGWIPLSDIKIGDKMVIKPHKINGEKTVSLNEAAWIGALIGDGCLTLKTPHFTCFDDILLKDLEAKLPYGLHLRRDVRSQFLLSAGNNGGKENPMKSLLVKCNLWGKYAHNKHIPSQIFQGTDQIVIEFLKYLYATDGWFSGHGVGYGTTSKRLAEDLHLILRRFNISASLIFKKKQDIKWRDQWHVLVTKSRDVLDFCDLIKVDCKKKSQDKIYKEAERRCAVRGGRTGKSSVKTRKIVSVKSIEPLGKKPVYDIVVDKTHNFLANGILTHNCWLDEPCPEAIYKANISRLRKGGILWISATPLTGSSWMYDSIIANKNNDKGKRCFVQADVESACKIHGVRGHLEHHHIEMIVDQYDEEDKQARVYGKFQHLIGLVFKKFDRNIHVVKPFAINKEDFVSVHALDTHPRIADKGLWVAIDKNGTKYVTNEISVDGSTSEVAARVKEISHDHRVVLNLLEPGAFIPDHHNDISLADRLDDNGLSYISATKTRTMADRRIRDAMDYEQMETPEGAVQVTRPPELYIFDNCTELISELEHYRWQEWRGISKDGKGPKQKPIDKDDHMIECLGRILQSEPRWTPNSVEEDVHYLPKNLDPY